MNSSHISSAARITARGFTQSRKITLQDVLLFYTFRHRETTNKDIISYFSKLLLKKVSESGEGVSSTLYDYIPNMKYICDTVRMEHKFLQFLSGRIQDMELFSEYLAQLEDDCSRNTVPVRPGRHYKRWGRWMSTIPTAKFRIDGRRNPPIQKCYNTRGYKTRK